MLEHFVPNGAFAPDLIDCGSIAIKLRRVLDAGQEETSSRRRGTGLGSRSRGQDLRNCIRGEISPAYIEEGSHQIAHHVMEKSAAAHAINEQIIGVEVIVAQILFP